MAPPHDGVQIPVTHSRLKVAVDVDEVLGRFLAKLNEFCKDKFGWDYQVSDYFSYDFHKVWKCTPQEATVVVHDFFDSPHFKNGLDTIPGSREALATLGSTCDLVIVTSRQHYIEEITLKWLEQHFSGLFEHVYFGNVHCAQGTPSRKKRDICLEIGAHVLIDDNVGYAIECAAAGIHVLLYDWDGGYPWSKMPEGAVHERIAVVHNWDQVQAAINALEAASTHAAGPAVPQPAPLVAAAGTGAQA